MEPFVIGIACVGGFVLLALMLMYNSVIGARNACDQAFSTIDVMLKKRTDLIPNLVASVKQYMQHESQLLERITTLRAKAIDPTASPGDRLAAEGALTGALGQLRVAVENYPDLKANQNFLQLQGSLNETEEQISAARRAFNAAVTALNNRVEMLPTSLIAGLMGVGRRTLFELPEAERRNVDVAAMFTN